MNYILLIDLETTGLNPKTDKIVEIAWILTDSDYNIINSSSHLISTYSKYTNTESYNINKISKKQLLNAGIPIEASIAPLYHLMKRNDIIVTGYNIGFDLYFLYHELLTLNIEPIVPLCFDILPLVRKKVTNTDDHKLRTIYNHLFGEEDTNFHRAYSDVMASLRILKKLITNFQLNEVLLFQSNKEYLYSFILKMMNDKKEIEAYYYLKDSVKRYILRPYMVNKNILEAYDVEAKFIKKYTLNNILFAKSTGYIFITPDYAAIESYDEISLGTSSQ
ncbi:Exonuclease domain protein [Candidatus Magnetoovum chiemensis]|nr:Exonuclease domain protein [Candidatus Magnetoovum chiemensis]